MGKIKRFNRHQNMKEVTRTVILMLTRESTIRDNDNLTNMLYGLFDGYDYTDDIMLEAEKMFDPFDDNHRLLDAICNEVKKYPEGVTKVA